MESEHYDEVFGTISSTDSLNKIRQDICRILDGYRSELEKIIAEDNFVLDFGAVEKKLEEIDEYMDEVDDEFKAVVFIEQKIQDITAIINDILLLVAAIGPVRMKFLLKLKQHMDEILASNDIAFITKKIEICRTIANRNNHTDDPYIPYYVAKLMTQIESHKKTIEQAFMDKL